MLIRNASLMSTQNLWKYILHIQFLCPIEEAYWFGPFHLFLDLSVDLSVTLALGQERLQIGSWNLVCGMSMKIKTRIFFLVHLICHCRVIALFQVFSFHFYIVSRWSLWTNYLENPLSQGHDIWITEWLINFRKNFLNPWLNYLLFLFF